ncbi:MAG: hypothetical protein JWN24_3218 [Phycisphaerales bacterium]|nr:hypothetical protein [Phycisphaerales bacterium]
MTAPLAQSEKPAVESTIRTLLRVLCVILTFYSVFMVAHGLMMTGQILKDDIPAGVIQSIRTVKSGYKLQLDTGRRVVFPFYALDNKSGRVELAVGDRVEKKPDSAVYLINGRALTNRHWLLREWLLPMRIQALFGAYLFFGGVYAFMY